MRSLLSVSDIEDEVTRILDIASDFKAGKTSKRSKVSNDFPKIIYKNKSFL